MKFFFFLVCAGSLLLCGLSSNLSEQGLANLLWCARASHCGWWLLLLQSTGSRALRLQYLWLLDSRAQSQYLWRMGLVAQQHVGFSQIRDPTYISCIGRWILYQLSHQGSPFTVWILNLTISREKPVGFFLLGMCQKYKWTFRELTSLYRQGFLSKITFSVFVRICLFCTLQKCFPRFPLYLL